MVFIISYVAELVSDYFVKNKIVLAEDKNIYKYGTEIAVSSAFGILAIILVSAILGRFQDGVLYLLCFIPIRVYAGGFHMSTYFKCNAAFISSSAFILYISNKFPKKFEFYISIILIIISLITVIILSPIENKNKSVSLKEQKKYKKLSIIISILWTAIALLSFIFYINILPLISLTIFTIAILMIVEKINQIKFRRVYHE